MDWLGKSYYNFGAIDCWSYGSGALFWFLSAKSSEKSKQSCCTAYACKKPESCVHHLIISHARTATFSSATSSPLGFWEMFLSQWYPFLDSGRVAQCGRRKSISSYCGSAKHTWQTWQTCLWWKWCMKCDVRCETEVFRSHKSWTQNVLRIWTSELRIKDNLLRSFRFSWWSFTASFSTSWCRVPAAKTLFIVCSFALSLLEMDQFVFTLDVFSCFLCGELPW